MSEEPISSAANEILEKHKGIFRKLDYVAFSNTNLFPDGLNCQAILEVDDASLLCASGFGQSSLKLLSRLRKELAVLDADERDRLNSLLEQGLEVRSLAAQYDLGLSDEQYKRYKKLLVRLQNLRDSNASLLEGGISKEGILDLKLEEFSSLPGIGQLYINLLVSLQETLNNNGDHEDFSAKSKNHDFLVNCSEKDGFKYSDLRVCLKGIGEEERRTLTVIIKKHGYSGISIGELFEEYETLRRGVRIGVKAARVRKVLDKIEEELRDVADFEKYFQDICNKAVAADKYIQISPEALDEVLVRDVDDYLFGLDDTACDLIQCRWGYHAKQLSLELAGKRHGITRERVRQIVRDHTWIFSSFCRVSGRNIYRSIVDSDADSLEDLFPRLRTCFESDKALLRFLDMVLDLSEHKLASVFQPTYRNRVLKNFFCENGSPAKEEQLIDYLMSNYGYERTPSVVILKGLEKNGFIFKDESGYFPRLLRKHEAVAHALISQPSGLPWKDVAKICNANSYSNKKLNVNRLTNHDFDSEYVYQSGRGEYRHVKYLELSTEVVEGVLVSMQEYLKGKESNAANLGDFYCDYGKVFDQDYFAIRHIARGFGKQAGIYFQGKSNVDTISLCEDVSVVGQKQLILERLSSSEVALTSENIAGFLKSKSSRHSNLYLHELIEEGKVVRTGYKSYWVPDKAFKDLDEDLVLDTASRLLKRSGKTCTLSWLADQINKELDLSKSKHVLAGLIKYRLEDLNVFSSYQLISVKPLEWSSLNELVFSIVSRTGKNVDAVDELVATIQINRDSAWAAVGNVSGGS